MFVSFNDSTVPVPDVFNSKLLLVAVVSTLLPAILTSSVLSGPPNISPFTVRLSTSICENVVIPCTVSEPVIVSSPVTVKSEPSNVKFALSSTSPDVPPNSIRLLVKSVTRSVGVTVLVFTISVSVSV